MDHALSLDALVPGDTSPEAFAVQMALLRRRTPVERMQMTQRIRHGAESMARARLERQYPDDTPRQRQLRLAALRYGDELVKRVFGWDPAVEGR